MPIRLDDEHRITKLQAGLLAIGLNWNKQYRLLDEGPKWSLQFIRPITYAQLQQAQELVDTIMNK